LETGGLGMKVGGEGDRIIIVVIIIIITVIAIIVVIADIREEMPFPDYGWPPSILLRSMGRGWSWLICWIERKLILLHYRRPEEVEMIGGFPYQDLIVWSRWLVLIKLVMVWREPRDQSQGGMGWQYWFVMIYEHIRWGLNRGIGFFCDYVVDPFQPHSWWEIYIDLMTRPPAKG